MVTNRKVGCALRLRISHDRRYLVQHPRLDRSSEEICVLCLSVGPRIAPMFKRIGPLQGSIKIRKAFINVALSLIRRRQGLALIPILMQRLRGSLP